MDKKEVRQLLSRLIKAAGDPRNYEGDRRPGIETAEITLRDAWDLIELLRELKLEKQPSMLERIVDDLSFLSEVFEYIQSEKQSVDYVLNFKGGKLNAVTRKNR